MRTKRIRWDLGISLLIATVLLLGLLWLCQSLNIVSNFLDFSGEQDSLTTVDVPEDETGGFASEAIPRISTYEELRTTDSFFTMEKSSAGLYNYGSIEGTNHEWRMFLMDDNVLVAALVNTEKIQETDSRQYILPVGTVCREQPEILEAMQEKYGDRYTIAADLYIDMDGEAQSTAITSSYRMQKSINTVLVSMLPLAFFLIYVVLIFGIHAIGVKLGVFPKIFSSKKIQ